MQANTEKAPGPPVVLDHPYKLDFEARFDPVDGYIHVLFDGQPAITIDHIATSAAPRNTWNVRVGPQNQGLTPIVHVDVREVCVSP